MNFEYNLLNLLHNVREGGTLMAGYEYGYGRDKLKVSGRDGSRYAYVGNLVYRFTGSSFVFESGLFGEGGSEWQQYLLSSERSSGQYPRNCRRQRPFTGRERLLCVRSAASPQRTRLVFGKPF